MPEEFKLKPPKRIRDESEPFIIPATEESGLHGLILDRFITDSDHNGLISHEFAEHLKALAANAINESFARGQGNRNA